MRDDITPPQDARNSGRSPETLRRQFDEQRSYLDLVCAKYDEGEVWYAKHIASAIYVFVHDNGRNNKSLLTQMKLKDGIHYVSTPAPIDRDNLVMNTPLACIVLGDAVGYDPMFAAGGPTPVFKNSFRGWWEQIVIQYTNKITLSREKLIRCFRDNEGGSHFDARISDQGFKSLNEEPGVGNIHFSMNGQIVPTDGPHYATVRQIGWEFQQTLADIDPKALP